MSKSIRIIHIVIFILSLLLLSGSIKGQKVYSSPNSFQNEELLNPLFAKLYNLKKYHIGKINIVHIGDSHIQADFFTDVIRQRMQFSWGNAGYGFTFPYSAAKTNGTYLIRYSTNVVWQHSRNLEQNSAIKIGLSGIGLTTSSDNFFLNLKTDDLYGFNTIKLIHPTMEPCFTLSSAVQNITTTTKKETVKPVSNSITNNIIYHKVKSGETLYRLSVNYNVPLEEIKRHNSLKSNTIKVGEKIKIPQKTKATTPQIINKEKEEKTYNIGVQDTSLHINYNNFYSEFKTNKSINEVTIVPNKKTGAYNLNGIVLENDNPGIIYHAIGVNGAKTSDFNRYPLFFEQLPILNPDLIIISLGTNESFGNMSVFNYLYQMKLLIKNIQKRNKDVPILIMTSPPSLIKRRLENSLLTEYSKALMGITDCIIWNLHSKLGGESAPKSAEYSSLMAKDKIHYNKEGYRLQGNLFLTDFFNAYSNYKKTKNLSGNDIE